MTGPPPGGVGVVVVGAGVVGLGVVCVGFGVGFGVLVTGGFVGIGFGVGREQCLTNSGEG